jgi:hypothetical protein
MVDKDQLLKFMNTHRMNESTKDCLLKLQCLVMTMNCLDGERTNAFNDNY